MTLERFAIGDGPVRTLYPGTKYGDRLAAERNAALASSIDAQPTTSVKAHISHVPRPAARKPRMGKCFRLLNAETEERCGKPFTFAGAPNRPYCDECSEGISRRGRG